ncbi:MAG TPA: ABC transporter substrate-binding protein [Fervidobacterium sp.]|nr:ABC transporter substrate-binding protein [Fervidobacterium sp.]HOM73612.1 ABC transporter substrate-binding protein [Fervidobacterium sp.]HRD19971.1 ABC transporter substrate-binding protein [Fervidobacterium sp.]
MRKVLVTLFVSLLVIFSFAAYIGEDATGKKGGTLTVGTLSGPRTLNDTVSKETSSSDVISMFMGYGGTLIEMDENGNFYPALAEKWDGPRLTKDGGMEIIWYLRKGVKWSDGKPFTADDVVFTLNDVYVNPDIVSSFKDILRSTNDYLPKATKINDYTVRMYYPEPFRLALRYLGGMYIFPKHVAESWVKNKKFAEFWTVDSINKKEIVALGPFIPVEYVPDQYVRFTANPNYWKKDKSGTQLPYLKEFIFKIISSQDAMKLAFENGEIDIYSPRGTEFAYFKENEKKFNITVLSYGPAYGTEFITFNWNNKDEAKRDWFRNVHFRKAVAYAMDKKKIIDTLYNGLAIEQWSPVSMASPYYNEKVTVKYPYDLNKAKAELKLGGFTWDKNGKLLDSKGRPVKFMIETNAGNKVREGMANIIASALKQLGMDITMIPGDFNTMVNRMLNVGDWDAIIIGLTGGDEPQGGNNVWALDGSLHFWNLSPELADWVDPKIYTIPDFEKQIDKIFKENVRILDDKVVKDYWAQFQKLASENIPLVYTVNSLRLYAWRNTLKNVRIGLLQGTLWNADWLYKE